MTSAPSNHRENVPDGYFYQLHTLLHCIHQLRLNNERFESYEIGNAIPDYGAIDDVVFHVRSTSGKKLTYALQVKQAKSDKEIDNHSLWDGPKSRFYVFKYFKSFLKIKQRIPLEQLQELIIWTHMDWASDARALCEEFEPNGDWDVLGSEDEDFSYDRYRIVHYQDFAQSFLKMSHPLAAIAEKFVDVMFKKETWDTKRAAKDYYRVMAKEVINNEGDKARFREEFVAGDECLFEHTLLFRELFERAMTKKFSDKNIGQFCMKDLNCDLYRNYFELIVDQNFKEGKRAVWKIDGYEPVQQDLEDFFTRFVFYVNVPKLQEMTEFLAKRFCVDYGQLSMLIEKCTFGTMVERDRINHIFTLLSLRTTMDHSVNAKLNFQSSGIQELKKQVSAVQKFLYVRAAQDVEFSVYRILSLVESDLQPCGKRYLAFRHANFVTNSDRILSILNIAELAKNGLQFIIVSFIGTDAANEIMASFKDTNIKMIFVGCQPKGELLFNCLYFEDEFDVNLFSPNNKKAIQNTKISLFGLLTKAGDIFSEQLFKKENSELALQLYRCRKEVYIGVNDLEMDPHFVARVLKQDRNVTVDFEQCSGLSPIVISDQSGMGKSIELVNIAVKLRKTFRNDLVVFVDCKVAVSYFMGDVIDMVCRILAAEDILERLIVKELFLLGKVTLLMDSYDEVSNMSSRDLEQLTEAIAKTNIKRLYIATKPHCVDAIKKVFPYCVVCKLDPFSSTDQFDYLKSFWDIDNIPVEATRLRVEQNAKCIVDKFRNIFRDNTLLGIPLQTNMIAVIYRNDIRSEDFELPQSYQIGGIVKRFVDSKLDRLSKQFSSSNRAHELVMRTVRIPIILEHTKMAFKIHSQLIDRQRRNHTTRETSRIQPQYIQNLCEDLQVYGLVRLKPSIGFIHQTYLNYFLALFYLTYSTEEHSFKAFMRQHLCTSRVCLTSKFLDFHIDNIEATTALQSIDSEDDNTTEDDRFTPHTTARLHPDKIRQFHNYFRLHCTENEVYTLIRNSFNASVFNVFEVLYDSLPITIKTKLKFRFGSQPEIDHAINLKLLGEYQIEQLLAILRKKNPTDVVRKYIVDFDDDEEDFIAVTCRKPFLKVFEWLSELYMESSVEERTVLEDYITRRLAGYVELTIRHNNSQMLQKIINWSKNVWDKESTGRFLREHDILHVFARNIGEEGSTKKLQIDRRVDMVQIMHDMFTWSRESSDKNGNNCTFNSQCLEVLKTVQIKEIKRKIEEIFFEQSSVVP